MITDEEDEPLPISSDYTWPLVLFAIVAIILIVGASIALRHNDPQVAGTFVAGDNLFRDFKVDFSDKSIKKLNPIDRHVFESTVAVVA